MKKIPTYFMLSILTLMAFLLASCDPAEVAVPTKPAAVVEEAEPEEEELVEPEEVEEEVNEEEVEVVEEVEPAGVQSSSDNFSEEEIAELEQFILETMEQDQIAGAAVALIDGSETIWAKGFGLQDVADNTPATTETLFHIASTQKSMTSFLMATLVDEGIVDWDTPVVEYDPDFELADEESTNSVTLRHLLTMTSGIPEEAEEDFDYESYAEDVYTYLPEIELNGAPGENYSYSNIAVSIAAYIGVTAVGEEYEDLYTAYQDLFIQKVIEPIGMNDVIFLYSDALESPHYGHSYQLDGDEWVEAEPEDVDADPLAPSGYIKANVMDMAKFISTQINKGVAPNGNQVVSAENLMETWEPALEDYGMGWQKMEYNGMTFYVHDGYYDNYTSVIGFSPDKKIGFVVLNNSADMGDNLIWGVPEKIAGFLEE